MLITQVPLLFIIYTVRGVFLVIKILRSIYFFLFEGVPVRVKALRRAINRFDFLMFNPLFLLCKTIVNGILGGDTVVAVSFNMSSLALKTSDDFTYEGYRFYSTSAKFSAESS